MGWVDTAALALIALALVAIAALQVRRALRPRPPPHVDGTAAAEVVRMVRDPEFRQALRRVWEIPDDASAEDIRALGPDTRQAIVQTASTFETLAVLVHHRVVPLSLVAGLVGEPARVAWRKTQPLAHATRRAYGSYKPYEWFEWLVLQLEAHAPPDVPAAHLHRDWRP